MCLEACHSISVADLRIRQSVEDRETIWSQTIEEQRKFLVFCSADDQQVIVELSTEIFPICCLGIRRSNVFGNWKFPAVAVSAVAVSAVAVGEVVIAALLPPECCILELLAKRSASVAIQVYCARERVERERGMTGPPAR